MRQTKASGVSWDNGRRGANKMWTHEIRWPASNTKNIIRVTSKHSDSASHKKACAILDRFNLRFISGWVPVKTADHADEGHIEALVIDAEEMRNGRQNT